MHCDKFGWNWLSGSGEEDFKILSMYFRYFVIISPLKMAGPFIWTNLNPLHPGMPSLVNLFLLFSNYLPFWEGRGPLFEQNWISFTQDYFVPSLIAIGAVVLEKKMKMWKVYANADLTTTTTTTMMDNGQILIRKAQLSLQLKWTFLEILGYSSHMKKR